MALQAHVYMRAKNGCRRKAGYDFVLVGVDQNPVSIPIVSSLLEAWRSRSSLNHLGIELNNKDAFDVLSESGSLDAIVNNPPWGANLAWSSSAPLAGFYFGIDRASHVNAVHLSALDQTRFELP
jgi:23S rRNA G2445 N2-methylase RlmL